MSFEMKRVILLIVLFTVLPYNLLFGTTTISKECQDTIACYKLIDSSRWVIDSVRADGKAIAVRSHDTVWVAYESVSIKADTLKLRVDEKNVLLNILMFGAVRSGQLKNDTASIAKWIARTVK